MTDTAGTVPPFPGFPGFPPAEMLDRMWGMMRFTPFGSAFPGAEPGVAQAFGPSLSMMSDMMAPLTNVEELDKRITDLRAVEQWLKLNLNMLQSAIQALEVQRATLATLRAFGAFAQSQMTPPPPSDEPAAYGSASQARRAEDTPDEPQDAPTAEGAESPPAFDASGWWNLLQSQFNQLAQFAMAQPVAAAQGAAQAVQAAQAAAAGAAGATGGGEQAADSSGSSDSGEPPGPSSRPAAAAAAAPGRSGASRSSARPPGAPKRPASDRDAPRAGKKTRSQPK